MKRTLPGLLLCSVLMGCGSGPAPFGGRTTDTDGDGPGGTVGAIPAALASDLESFTYNASAETLTIRGVTAEDGPFQDVYRRRPALDEGEYQAFTAQDGSLDRHSTAYVRDIRGTRAAVAVTGGQFGYYFAGGAYSNSGNYTSPVAPGSPTDGGLVQYGGNYVGAVNVDGSGEDLLPVAPGTEASFRPGQAAEITGRTLITASFADGSVSGIITERQIPDRPTSDTDPTPLRPDDLELAPTSIAADGTFFGDSSVGQQTRGEYGGIFGGPGATEVAGIVHAENHINGIANSEEYGVFVLAQCGTPDADPVCNQPNP